MTLSELLQDVKVKDKFTDVVIKDVTDSTACITPGCVFVCIRGERTDGSVFARQALAMGAVCVVCERELGLEKQVIVADARRAYAQMCAALSAIRREGFGFSE